MPSNVVWDDDRSPHNWTLPRGVEEAQLKPRTVARHARTLDALRIRDKLITDIRTDKLLRVEQDAMWIAAIDEHLPMSDEVIMVGDQIPAVIGPVFKGAAALALAAEDHRQGAHRMNYDPPELKIYHLPPTIHISRPPTASKKPTAVTRSAAGACAIAALYRPQQAAARPEALPGTVAAPPWPCSRPTSLSVPSGSSTAPVPLVPAHLGKSTSVHVPRPPLGPPPANALRITVTAPTVPPSVPPSKPHPPREPKPAQGNARQRPGHAGPEGRAKTKQGRPFQRATSQGAIPPPLLIKADQVASSSSQVQGASAALVQSIVLRPRRMSAPAVLTTLSPASRRPSQQHRRHRSQPAELGLGPMAPRPRLRSISKPAGSKGGAIIYSAAYVETSRAMLVSAPMARVQSKRAPVHPASSAAALAPAAPAPRPQTGQQAKQQADTPRPRMTPQEVVHDLWYQ